MAMQGLAVVPLFAGYDLNHDQGRIFSYDVTGGRYEETAFHSVGSGSLFARGSLKKLYREDFTAEQTVQAVVEALYDAADDDSATGGPDITRRIFPVVQVITADGGRRMPDGEVAAIADRVIAGRMNRPDGPAAPLDGSLTDMSMPFYVSPEQLMKDRADFARKGIARGRSVVVVQYADGVLFVSENPSQALHKVSEIYDRIAFAAVGRYNEFENLRIAGVRLADMRGYAYDRRDVTGRGLANAYAQTLGTIFSSGGEKPYEVELFVAEIGDAPADDQIYRLTYDGQVADEHGYAVMGGAGGHGGGVPQGALHRGRLARRRRPRRRGRARPQPTTRSDRVIPDGGPRGGRAGPHPHPAAEVQPDPAGPARRAARRPWPGGRRHAAGRGPRPGHDRPDRRHRRPGRPHGPDERRRPAAREPHHRRTPARPRRSRNPSRRKFPGISAESAQVPRASGKLRRLEGFPGANCADSGIVRLLW